MKFAGWLTLALVFITFAYIAGADKANDVKIAAARDTVRITDSVAVVRSDTVKVREKARQHWDTVVRNVTDTQVVIQRDSSPPDTVTVPVEVIRRDEAKDLLILSLYQRDTSRVEQIAARDRLIALYRPPRRIGFGLTVGPGCNRSGCEAVQVTVGVTIRLR